MPLYTDFSKINSFSSYLTVLSQKPELNLLVGSGLKQPSDQLAVIADYTNSYKSRAASTCDSAIDYLILSKLECPSDANFLEKISVFSAKTLLGQKCCFILTDYP